MKLSAKLFSIFVLTALLVVVILVGTLQLSAYRNFSDYITRVELEKLDPLVDALKAFYLESGSWDILRKEPRHWPDLLHMAAPEAASNQDRQRQAAASGPGPGLQSGRPGWPPLAGRPPGPFPPGPGGRPGDRGMPSRDPLGIGPRLTLFDKTMTVVSGAQGKPEDLVFKEIQVSGKTVGWLGLKKPSELTHPLDTAYIREQTKAMYLTGGLILLVSGLISLILARHLLKPVQALIRGTRAMTERKFETRIPVASRDELGQLARDFNTMAGTIQVYETMRRQWMTDISHELRTPLAILSGEIEAMQDGIRVLDDAGLQSLHAEASRMTNLVEDLHLLALEDSNNLTLVIAMINPMDVLEETLDTCRSRFLKCGIEIDFHAGDKPVPIPGDAYRLKQLFMNLLENTLRYTDSPGRLRIRMSVESTTLNIRFDDSAPGVPDGALEKLFDRLYRVEASRSRALGGSGLGLSICRSIARAHGGSIGAAHSDMGGLGITLSLPLEKPGQKQ